MRKIFYSVFIMSSVLIAGVVHAEEIKPTMMRMNSVVGSGTPPTMNGARGDHKPMIGTGTPPMRDGKSDERGNDRRPPLMGSGTPAMMPPVMGSSTGACTKFNRGLALGARGEDVKELQEMLHEKGFLNASSTGYFGKMTKEAVMKFQKDGGINPSGFFGELSRKQHEKRCGEGKGRGEGKQGDTERRGASSTPPFMGGWNGTGTPPLKDHDDRRPQVGSGTPPMIPPPATTTASSTTI